MDYDRGRCECRNEYDAKFTPTRFLGYLSLRGCDFHRTRFVFVFENERRSGDH